MIVPSIPDNEELRLKDLYYYDILDTEAESDFNDLLEIASEKYNCPIVAISFIDRGRQWFKAKKGLDVDETPRDVSFCGHAILEEKPLIVNDASKDARFSDNPLVLEHNIKFYAGVPIVSQQGFHLGTVCVIDKVAKDFSQEQTTVLKIISNQVSKLIELRLKNKLLKQSMEEQIELEKSMMRKTISRYDQEKLVISNEIQENIAQSLAATNFYLELSKKSDSRRDELIEESKRNISNVVNQLRKLSVTITPSTLQNLSLKFLIEDQVVSFQRSRNIYVDYTYKGAQQVNNTIAICVYRAIQEQLENIASHSKADVIKIDLEVGKEDVILQIDDNGTDFKIAEFKKGVGLNAVISRIESFGGNVLIRQNKNNGFNLNVRIPLKP